MMYTTLKKILAPVLTLCFISHYANGADFQSNVASGNWRAAGSWTITSGTDADGIPDNNDNVTILSGHTINWGVLSSSNSCSNLTINNGGTLKGPGNLTFAMNIFGNYTNNGTETGRGLFLFDGAGTTISGTGTFVNNNQWVFNTSRTIAAGVTNERVYWTRLYSGASIVNEGNLTLRALIAYDPASSFTNIGTVTLTSNDFMNVGSFDASAIGNTVIISWKAGASGPVIPEPITSFYNLRISSISVNNEIDFNLDVDNDLTLDFDVIFDMGGFDMTIGGDYDDQGSDDILNYNSITFDGTGAQSIDIDATGGVDATQWDCDVTIGASSITTTNANLRVNDLTIAGTFDVSAGNSEVEIQGDWVNNGTFVPQTSRVYFNGNSPQTLSGSSLTQFYHVNFDNSAGVSFTGGTYELIAQLRVNAGTVNAGSNLLTVISDASFTGSIRTICSTCSLTGTITMQRFIAGGAADYRDISCPFPGGLTFAQWDGEMLISCPSCPDGCAFGQGCFVSIKSFDASTQTYADIGGISATINNGVGYEAFFGDDLATFSGTTLTTTGTVNGPSNIVRTMTAGWNLVGNPYCADIDFDGLIVGSNVSDFYYIYDSGTGGFEYYDASGATVPANSGNITSNGHVASSQGFWVLAQSGGAFSRQLHFLQAAKRGSGESLVKSTAGAANPQFFVKVLNKSNHTSCKSKLVMLPNAIAEFDTCDIPLFRGPEHPIARKNPFLSFSAGTEYLRLNAIDYNPNLIIREFDLMFNSEVSGRFEISAEDLGDFAAYNCILLYDSEENKYTNLRVNNYTFEYDGSEFDVDGRFKLILSNEAMCDIMQSDDIVQNSEDNKDAKPTSIVCTQIGSDIIHVSVSNKTISGDLNTNLTVRVYNMFGQLVHNGQYQGNEFNLNAQLSTGTYVIKVDNGQTITPSKIVVR